VNSFTLRAIAGFVVTLIAGLLVVTVYAWYIGAPHSSRFGPELKAELAQISIPASDHVVDAFTQYKTGVALVGQTIWSPNNWEKTREFYEAEMARLGWTLVQPKNIADAELRNGKQGGFDIFKKGSVTALIEYDAAAQSGKWTYTVDVSVGLHN
jgi:hypothetical protein